MKKETSILQNLPKVHTTLPLLHIRALSLISTAICRSEGELFSKSEGPPHFHHETLTKILRLIIRPHTLELVNKFTWLQPRIII